jgi:uncharacterized protein (TIGR04255 family)
MSVTFKNAPLVELIAELRWDVTRPTAHSVQMPMGISSEQDQFFMRLGGELYQHGFQQAERLIPPGFPVLPQQVVYRFRKHSSEDSSVLFHAGLGVFSTHATPPYRSWDAVKATVEIGVRALLSARAAEDNDKSFSAVTIRYINGFGSDLTDGREIDIFIKDVFGFDIRLPPALIRHIKPNTSLRPNFQFGITLSNGSKMGFLVGEGLVNNQAKIVVDLTIASAQPVAPDADVIMATFTEARNVIHKIFVDLTMPIETKLQPVTENDDT